MANDTKTVEIEEKPETSTQSVSQPSANVSTSAPADEACTSKETEPKVGGSGKATDTVNSSSNKSTISPLKETDDILKRPLVEEDKEVKPKKHKEDHNQCYKVPSGESQIPSKSLQKATSDAIGVEEQKSLHTRILRSSNRCKSNSSGAPSRSASPIIPDEKLGQTTLPGAVTVDSVSGNSSSPPATRSEQSKNILAIVSGDDKQAATSAAATVTTASSDVSGKELHPRRRKLKASRTESKTSDSTAPNVTVVPNPSGTTCEPVPVTNCYQMFLDIRKQIEEKHKNLYPVKPKPPSGFKDYLMNKRTYVLAGNYNSRIVNTQNSTPANLHKQLIKLFVEQEKERQRLHLQHIVEKEKLVLSVEQEILRVHGRAALASANQLLPFSVCTILKDDEVYNIMTPEQEKKKNRHTRTRYNGRLFLSWLQDVDDKWEKIKESLLLRHHNEADSLHAVQKMDWGWKLKELQLCTYSSEPNIDEEHVPIVPVSDDLDLLPA